MRLAEYFFRIIAPDSCLNCQREGSLLCAWCTEQALPETEERCYRCNALSADGKTCQVCRRKSPIRFLWQQTEYSHIAKQLVQKMKFSYSADAATVIARELARTLPSLPAGTIVVHVPSATAHVRQRGFDHAEHIAKQLAARSGLPHQAVLSRTNQLRQVGAGRQTRLQQLKGAFRTRSEYLISGSHIVLVDDVMTTGATLEEAARTLKSAGAKTIDAIIFARAK